MCFVARGLEKDKTRVIGVATNKGNNGYDFLFMKMPDWTPENEALKIQLQDEYGIFKSPRITITSEDEYPPLEEEK